MMRWTWAASASLIVLGVGVYLATQMGHITSLIPAFVGIFIGLCGVVALKASFRMVAMHVAMVVALLLGVSSLGMGIPGLITLISTGSHDRGIAPVVQTGLGVILVTYLALGITSFIQARRGENETSRPGSPAATAESTV